MQSPDSIREALKAVKFPGYSRDIVSFGLVKDVAVNNGAVSVLVFIGRSYQSSQFYSPGHARAAGTMAQLDALLSNTSHDFIAIQDDLLDTLDMPVKTQFCVVGRFEHEVLLAEQRCTFATSRRPIANLIP